MSKIMLTFLKESFLYEKKHIENGYKYITHNEIKKELENYRNYIINNIDKLYEKVIIYANQIKMYQPNLELSFTKVKQMAFYLDQVITQDKLFEVATPEKKFNDVYNKLLGNNEYNSEEFIKNKLVEILKEIQSAEEMIQYEYLYMFPISYFSETGTDIPIKYSENGYNGILPSNIQKFYYEHVLLRCFEQINGNKLKLLNKFEPCRSIEIKFQGEENMLVNMYNLFEQKVTSYNSNDGTYSFEMYLPTTPPSEKTFKSWVNQSINTTAISHFQETMLNVNLSYSLKSYLSTSNFTNALLSQNIDSHTNLEMEVIDSILNLDLNFYNDIDLKTLMSIRQNDGEEFSHFRKTLEQKMIEIRSITNQEAQKEKIKDIKHELMEVEVNTINKKIKNAKSNALKDLTVGIAGLGLSSITSGVSLAATFYSLAAGYKDYNNYINDVKLSPAYFLWKIKNISN